jgi:hypothetical protein
MREHDDHRQGFILLLESTVAGVTPFCFLFTVSDDQVN